MGRQTSLQYGGNETIFTYLEKDTFPLSDISVEPSLEGDVSLELERERTEKSVSQAEVGSEKYHVTLNVGRLFACSMGVFREEESAQTRYRECHEALRNGRRLSVSISMPIKILPS